MNGSGVNGREDNEEDYYCKSNLISGDISQQLFLFYNTKRNIVLHDHFTSSDWDWSHVTLQATDWPSVTGTVSGLVRTDDSDGDHPLALSRSVTPSKDGADNPRDRDSSLTSVTECDNTFTHSDLHNAPESNKFNKNILFC